MPKRQIVTAFLFAFFIAAPMAHAAVAGRVLEVRGKALAWPKGDVTAKPLVLTVGADVPEGAIIRTAEGATVRLVMQDKSLLNLGPSTELRLTRYRVAAKEKKRSVGVRLMAGRLWARVTSVFGGDRNFAVQTENAVAGVRGTEFVVDVDKDGATHVTVLSGAVEVGVLGTETMTLLSALQRSVVSAGGRMNNDAISAQQARALASSLGANELDSQGAADRLDSAAASGSEQAAPADSVEDAPAPVDELEDATKLPVDLDPATGETRVQGTIEVRP